MNVGFVTELRPSTDPAADAGAVRPAQTPPILGSDSTGESNRPQADTSVTTVPQDVVKVQMEPPGEIVVYQFVDQRGTVVLQVPPPQLLDLAQQISQELEPKARVKVPAEEMAAAAGGKSNGR